MFTYCIHWFTHWAGWRTAKGTGMRRAATCTWCLSAVRRPGEGTEGSAGLWQGHWRLRRRRSCCVAGRSAWHPVMNGSTHCHQQPSRTNHQPCRHRVTLKSVRSEYRRQWTRTHGVGWPPVEDSPPDWRHRRDSHDVDDEATASHCCCCCDSVRWLQPEPAGDVCRVAQAVTSTWPWLPPRWTIKPDQSSHRRPWPPTQKNLFLSASRQTSPCLDRPVPATLNYFRRSPVEGRQRRLLERWHRD